MIAVPAPASRARAVAPLLVLATFFGVGVVLYGPVLSGPFLSDDYEVVLGNPYVHALSFENLRAILDPSGTPAFLAMNYAPVHLLVHAAAWAAFGDATLGHHVLGVALHALASTLLFLVFVRFGASPGAALAGAAIFFVHPANVEAVAWIGQQKTTVAACLAFASLLLFDRRPISAAAFFGLALLAKAAALFVWPVAAARAWLARDPRAVHGLVASAILAVAFAFVELPVFGAMGASEVVFPSIATHIRVIFAVFGRYVEMALLGLGTGALQEPPFPSWADPHWLLGLGVALAAAMRAVAALRRRKVEAVYWVWIAAAFAPVSQWTPFPFPVADRYLYFMLPGFLGLAVTWADAFGSSPVRRRALAATAAAAIGGFAMLGAARVPLFDSEDLLRAEAVTRYPSGRTAALFAAQQAAERGEREDALAALERVREIGDASFLVVAQDPRYRFLADDPRYRAVVSELATRAIRRLGAQPAPNQLQQRTLALAHLARGELNEAIAALERARSLGGPIDRVVEYDLSRLRRLRDAS